MRFKLKTPKAPMNDNKKKENDNMTNEHEITEEKVAPVVHVASPWVTYYHEVEAMFKKDPEVTVIFSDKGPELKLLVEGLMKAQALESLLPSSKTFGNVELKITVVPANKFDTVATMLKVAFAGNDVLKNVVEYDTILGKMNYAIFKKDVAQFYNDELNDIHGVKSMLYADMAKEIFKPELAVNYNTDSDDMAIK